MANHIALIEVDKRNAVDIFQNILDDNEARLLFSGKVGLCDVACNNRPAVMAYPGQKHLHLCICSILSLIKNDKGVIESPPAHIGKRGNFNNIFRELKLKFIKLYHLLQRIVKWAEVGINLLLQIAGKKSQVFTRFHRRTRQDNTLNLPLLKRAYRKCHRGICFTRSCRTNGEKYVVIL